jgi:biopolymer transport protein ExbB
MDFHKISLLQVFIMGGPVMWPILLCSVFAFAIAMERFWYLRKISIDTQVFLKGLFESIKRHEIKEALQSCDNSNSPVARILKAGILKYDRPRSQIVEAIEDASLYEMPRIGKNLTVLLTIAHVSPLLGLLGTVCGMVKVFQAIQVNATIFHPVSPGDLAGGIWEALLATVAGLVVAIPAFIAYNYLVSLVNNFILEAEKSSTELINFLTE